MTPNDRAALLRLVAAGRAVVVRFKGHWLCGGQPLAQASVRRLADRGLAREEPVGVLVPTVQGLAEAKRINPRAGEPQDPRDPVTARSVARPEPGQDPAREETWQLEDGAEPYSPPDPRDGDGLPAALDLGLTFLNQR